MKKFVAFLGLLVTVALLVLEYVPLSSFLGSSSVTKTAVQTGGGVVDGVDVLADWDYNSYPLYYRQLGVSNIDTSVFPAEGQIEYSALDEFGRSGVARGTITYDMYKRSVGSEQKFTNADNPSGFDTVIKVKNKDKKVNWNKVYGQQKMEDYDGKVYSGWFYNRSHLIGDALGGDEMRENVVTGTRFQNVGSRSNDGGMRYPESTVENYFKTNGSSAGIVWYEAIPNYSGNEIVPRSVTVNFKSSDGKLDESVLVSNSVKGFTLDYNTGDFTKN